MMASTILGIHHRQTRSWALVLLVAAIYCHNCSFFLRRASSDAYYFSSPIVSTSPRRRKSSARKIIAGGRLFYTNDRHDPEASMKSSSSSHSQPQPQPQPQPQKNTDSSSSSHWTLREDWALIDQLPNFTIGQGDQTRTFWTQLAASSPALSSKSPEELYGRSQLLFEEHNEEQADQAATASSPKEEDWREHDQYHHRKHPRFHFGPAPPLLSQWRMDLTTGGRGGAGQSSDNRAVGTLDDGRVIWLHYHLIGRLPGDLFSDASSPSLMALIPGGYLEAVGGRIYELGQPANMDTLGSNYQRKHTASFSGNTFWQDDDDDTNHMSPSHHLRSSSDTKSSSGGPMAWWLPATTGTMSALLASTVLSACIGYGAGMGMIVDESGGPDHRHAGTVPPPTLTTTLSADRQHQLRGEQAMPTHYTASAPYSTPSLAERKALTEYRILREQRVLLKISEQLERDQADLQGLGRIQTMEQQHYDATAAASASNKLLP